jgi:Glycosyltransferase family 87
LAVAADGSGVLSDFVDVWAAGKLAWQGSPAAIYDWPVHKAMEVAAVGHPFDGYFGWHYPPVFLFVAAGLALMPYAAAYLLWIFGTFPLYLAAVRAIVGERVGYFLAAAFPAVLSNFIVGQNGFLSAALLGGSLLFIERRPVLAGVLLSLLAYTPHLGLLFPIVLAASGHWRVFIAAAVIAALMTLASWIAFGTET